MNVENFTFKDGDGVDIFVYKWAPSNKEDIKAVVQISHGMAETAERYEELAKVLTNNGYIVYANDHRGHGKTAKSLDEIGYLGEKDGFAWMVEDMYELTGIIKKENPKKSIILLGHSMGSFLTQKYISLYGKELKAAVLSGTNGKAGFILNLGILIAKIECESKGRRNKSERLTRMSFGGYNNTFKPNRTEFDWLSRDEAEVDKYVNNPFCGGVFTSGFYNDFLAGLKDIHKNKTLAAIPKELPVYIFSGDKDPVGNNGIGVKKLYEMYKKLGLKQVEMKLYEGGRHEMLNEVNKQQVMEDLLNWIEKVK